MKGSYLLQLEVLLLEKPSNSAPHHALLQVDLIVLQVLVL